MEIDLTIKDFLSDTFFGKFQQFSGDTGFDWTHIDEEIKKTGLQF